MELQFNKKEISCLHTVADGQIIQELTQELRILDGMPEIGRVLGCWGQILLRGKSWSSREMSAQGGVMVWVLYESEETNALETMEAWLPFQGKWELPKDLDDGTLILRQSIGYLDCRSVSARKLIIRCGVELFGEGFVPQTNWVYEPGDQPSHIQLLEKTYPMELSKCAGEKAFEIQDTWSAEDDFFHPQTRILYQQAVPVVTEYKVLSDKLVFRGSVDCKMLYLDPAGKIKCQEKQFSLSQYIELDQSFGNHATAQVDLLLTGLELNSKEEGPSELHIGLAAQYIIFDRELVTVVQDGYSTQQLSKVQCETLKLPVRLDVRKEQIPYRQHISGKISRLADTDILWSLPKVKQGFDCVDIDTQSCARILFTDQENRLDTVSDKWCHCCKLPAGGDIRVTARQIPEKMIAVEDPQGVSLSAEVLLEVSSFCVQEIPMVTGLTLGDEIIKSEERPSVVVIRSGEKDLWELAKTYCTTVKEIETINGFSEEKQDNAVLLIPVP